MKWGFVLVLLTVVLAAPAVASAPTLTGLQRQISVVRAQVVALQTAQKTLNANDQVTRDWATCFHAQDLDTSNVLWHVMNVDLASRGYPAQPDLPRFDDAGACQRVGQTRIR